MAREIIQMYRITFYGVIIDKETLKAADTLDKVRSGMGNIASNSDDPFGGWNVIFCGDLGQLLSMNVRAIFRLHRDSHQWYSP